MSVTIKDVARAAKVSVASVSRALNGHENVTPETRRVVVEVARKLGYVPHSAARSLITRRTQTLGVLLPDLHGEFFSELIRGIDQAARREGWHILVSSSHDDAEEAAAALRNMRGRVDGLLIMSPHVDAAVLAENLPSAHPTVLVNTRVEGASVPAFVIDNHAGATAMMRHLVSRGHRHIALITGPKRNFDAQERLRGYREAMAKLLPGTPELIIEGEFSEESGYQAGHRILALAQRPDAVFASNDMMAIGALFAFNEAGVQVPRDIALVGFDDIPIARFVTPPLTTVRVRIADLGTRATQRLIQAIAGNDESSRQAQLLKPELVVRASCGGDIGAPASAGRGDRVS